MQGGARLLKAGCGGAHVKSQCSGCGQVHPGAHWKVSQRSLAGELQANEKPRLSGSQSEHCPGHSAPTAEKWTKECWLHSSLPPFDTVHDPSLGKNSCHPQQH